MRQIAESLGKSEKWIRTEIDRYKIEEKKHNPRKVVLVLDATFWGRKQGVFVARDPLRKENLFWREIRVETSEDYRVAREEIEKIGYEIQAVVIDGKRGVRKVFSDIPVQYCQFHQVKTVTRYLTRKPKTEAGRELRILALSLVNSREEEFTSKLHSWHKKWESFLGERSVGLGARSSYTHKRLRSAYRSFHTNLPYLFTYQKFKELLIPNTTNTLDGSFSHLKNTVGLHRGKRPNRRYKIVEGLLTKKGGKT